MIDRRRWDPFAPVPRRRRAPAAAPVRDGLDDLKKPELVHLAAVEQLDTGGTRADLIARLRAAR
jgi:hypothetical protein